MVCWFASVGGQKPFAVSFLRFVRRMPKPRRQKGMDDRQQENDGRDQIKRLVLDPNLQSLPKGRLVGVMIPFEGVRKIFVGGSIQPIPLTAVVSTLITRRGEDDCRKKTHEQNSEECHGELSAKEHTPRRKGPTRLGASDSIADCRQF